MTFGVWYYDKIRTSPRLKLVMGCLIAPIVYGVGISAVFVQLFKNIWECLVDCWFSIGGTVSDINRYYRTNVFNVQSNIKDTE